MSEQQRDMIKIALVTGFSESCIPLVKQCVVSAYCSMKEFINQCEFTVYAYEYNWQGHNKILGQVCKNPQEIDYSPFTRQISLSDELHMLKNTTVVQKSASDIEHPANCQLPDIKVYHDFATKYFYGHDYALFCHNDIVINENCDVFQSMISILSKSNAAIIGEPHFDCREGLSIRIYPHFIFASSIKFHDYNLSFINNYVLFDKNIKSWPIDSDGGAMLLASCFQSSSKQDAPCYILSRSWFKHLRLYSDTGVESTNIVFSNSPMFKDLIDQSNKYVDFRLYLPGTFK